MVPMTTDYWDRVVSHSVSEIRAGRTPNPDMLCNSTIKFGAFYDYLDKQHGGRFERVASGHYARVLRMPAHCQAHAHAATQPGLTVEPCGPAPAGTHVSSSEQAQQQEEEGLFGGEDEGHVLLALTPDAVKDQTYFLAHLSRQQMRRTMFPLAGLTKLQVRGWGVGGGMQWMAK